MFKRVDSTEQINDLLEGFSYLNKGGCEETVSLSNGSLVHIEAGEDVCCIYKEDIPKLIKALEAVYNYKD